MRQNPELFNSKLSTQLLKSVLSCADVLVESESHCYSCDSCKCPDQDFPAPLYLIFVSTPAVYVRQTLDAAGGVLDYVPYTASQLKSVTKPCAWAFDIWDNNHLRESMATKVKFVGNP